MIFKDKVYNNLKWIALILLPAFGSLYFGLAEIWSLPYGAEVVGTTSLITVFIGALIGISTKNYNAQEKQYDGQMVVDTSDPNTDLYSIELHDDLDKLTSKTQLMLKVNSNPQIVAVKTKGIVKPN